MIAARLDAAHGAGDDLRLALRVLPEDVCSRSTSRRRWSTSCLAVWAWMRPKRVGVDLVELDEVADLGVGLDTRAPRRAMNWVCGSSTSSTTVIGAVDADPAGLAVDLDVDVLVARGGAAIGRLDGLLHGAHELLARDALLGVQLEKGADQIAAHVAPPPRARGDRPLTKNVGVTHVLRRPAISRREYITRQPRSRGAEVARQREAPDGLIEREEPEPHQVRSHQPVRVGLPPGRHDPAEVAHDDRHHGGDGQRLERHERHREGEPGGERRSPGDPSEDGPEGAGEPGE